jgi:hypothetical protein
MSQFEAILPDVKPYVAALDCLSGFCGDAVLSIDASGIRTTVVDTNHVVMVSMFMAAFDMESMRTCGKTSTFTADLKGLAAVLKLGSKRGRAVVSQEVGEDTLSIALPGSSFTIEPRRGFVNDDASMMDADIEASDPMKKHSGGVSMTFSAKEARKTFKEMASIGGDLSLDYDPARRTLKLTCKGPGGTAKYEFGDPSDESTLGNAGAGLLPGLLSISGDSHVSSRFDAKYLARIFKTDLGGKEIHASMKSSKLPLRVTHPLSEEGHLHFFLAPLHSGVREDGRDT